MKFNNKNWEKARSEGILGREGRRGGGGRWKKGGGDLELEGGKENNIKQKIKTKYMHF